MKKGDTFEVVEILDDGGFVKGVFKIGGWTISMAYGLTLNEALVNGVKGLTFSRYLLMETNKEVRPVGRLIVTKVKKT